MNVVVDISATAGVGGGGGGGCGNDSGFNPRSSTRCEMSLLLTLHYIIYR